MVVSQDPQNKQIPPRPWKGVLFPCCGVYGRVYQNMRTGVFEGFCPRCTRKARLIHTLLVALLLWLAWPSAPLWARDLHASVSDSSASLNSAVSADLSAVPPASLNSASLNTAVLDSTAALSVTVPDSSVALDSAAWRTGDSTLVSIPDSLLQPAADSTALRGGYIPPVAQIDVDSLRFHLWASASILFINFDHRDRFEAAIDTMYRQFLLSATTEKELNLVRKQDLQKVNFCFPVAAGIEVQLARGIYVGGGIGYFHNREAAVVIDAAERAHEVYYALQGVPLTLEMRFWIPPELISLSGHPRFAATVRRWWLLAGTEIYSTWGQVASKPHQWGHGWGFALGYEIARYKSLRLTGELGFSALRVNSDQPWSAVVPVYGDTDPTASWDLGGIQMQIRGSWGAGRWL